MPSRTDVPEYAEYLERIEALVAVVNHRHGTPDWMPIDLKLRDDLEEAVATYKHYDVMMVNAMFDGMNLVAKEGPLVNERDGVSILSENTGAHEELGEFSLSVNPFDVQELADAIYTRADDVRRRARAARAGAQGDRDLARSGRLDRRPDRGHPQEGARHGGDEQLALEPRGQEGASRRGGDADRRVATLVGGTNVVSTTHPRVETTSWRGHCTHSQPAASLGAQPRSNENSVVAARAGETSAVPPARRRRPGGLGTAAAPRSRRRSASPCRSASAPLAPPRRSAYAAAPPAAAALAPRDIHRARSARRPRSTASPPLTPASLAARLRHRDPSRSAIHADRSRASAAGASGGATGIARRSGAAVAAERGGPRDRETEDAARTTATRPALPHRTRPGSPRSASHPVPPAATGARAHPLRRRRPPPAARRSTCRRRRLAAAALAVRASLRRARRAPALARLPPPAGATPGRAPLRHAGARPLTGRSARPRRLAPPPPARRRPSSLGSRGAAARRGHGDRDGDASQTARAPAVAPPDSHAPG